MDGSTGVTVATNATQQDMQRPPMLARLMCQASDRMYQMGSSCVH